MFYRFDNFIVPRIACLILYSFILNMNAFAQEVSKSKHLSQKRLRQGNFYFLAGKDKFTSGDYPAAISALKSAIKYNPKLWKAYRLIGDAFGQSRQFDKAITYYDSALMLTDDTLSYFGRAEAYRVLKSFSLALTDYNKAILLDADNFTFHFGRGQCFIDLEQFTYAIEDFSFCLRLKPDSRPCFSKRGYAYFYLKQYRRSIDDFNKYFSLGGKEAAAYYYRGTSHLNLGSLNVAYADSAIADYEILEALDRNGNSFSGLGAAYGLKSDSVNSRKYFRLAVKANPNDAEIYYLWGTSEFNFQEYRNALNLFSKQASLIKEPSSQLFFSIAITNLALCEIGAGLDYFKKAIDMDSLNSSLYLARVGALFRLEEVDITIIAIGDLTRLINMSTSPQYTSALYLSRGFQLSKLGRDTEAMKDLNKALAIAPPQAINYILRGYFALRSNNVANDIITNYDLAIDSDRLLWQPWMMKSLLYHEINDREKSCKCLEMALSLGAQIDADIKQNLCSKKSKPKIERVMEKAIISDLLLKL